MKAGSNDFPSTVKEKTGKSWEEWFRVLDKAGCANMTHKEIVAHIRNAHPVSPWWEQMVTVGYEKHKGLRRTNEMKEGYRISASLTVTGEAENIYKKWKDTRSRRHWLSLPLDIRSETPFKRITFICAEDNSEAELRITEKAGGKCTMTLTHTKLASEQKAESRRAFWKDALQSLSGILS